MWRHLRMLKRGARSYDQTGIEGTSPGELAILCPACPNPSINLPPDWQSVGKDSEYVDSLSASPFLLTAFAPRYLYYQTFGIDACFRFKRRQISNYEKDPELGPGYAYFVAWNSYSEYLRQFTNQEEVYFVRSSLTRLD